MAESAVKSAADWLGKLIIEEGKHLLGATEKVEGLRDELIWLQSFLRDADTIQCNDEIVRLWVLQIKDYVSEAEDLIDDFVINVVSRRRRRQTSWKKKMKGYSLIFREWYDLHKTATGIDALKMKISMISPRLKDYGLKTSYSNLPTYGAREARNEQVQQRLKYIHIEQENIVGLEESATEIVNALLRDPERSGGVVALYGMGGLGKTTLATKVYYHKEIRQHFRGHAWAYVSKRYQRQTVLQKIVSDLSFKSTNGYCENDLISEIHQLLKEKKCLVVLDDVWTKEDWGALKSVFTLYGSGDSGSRVLITTRKEEVAKDADPKALAKPDILGEDESWELFKKTLGVRNQLHISTDHYDHHSLLPEFDDPEPLINSPLIPTMPPSNQFLLFPSSFYTLFLRLFGIQLAPTTQPSHSQGTSTSHSSTAQTGNPSINPQPPTATRGSDEEDQESKKKLGKKMLRYCKGLPLAIVALGGILRNKETVREWETVNKNISSYLRRGCDHGRPYMEVLAQSYSDLPYHLKPCFLHLANFPEDYEIYTERLYWMWIAEGLVAWSPDRITGTECLEDIANEYLRELTQGGMVQIVKQTSNGRIKSVRVHDLMRDVCLQNAMAENFLNIIDHRQCPENPLKISSYLSQKRLQRMAIYSANGSITNIPDSLSTNGHKHLRSLLFITGGHELVEVEDKYKEWMKRICNEFQWLRMLDLEGLCLGGRLTKQVKKMVHLRYLSLKETKVSEVPSCICNLRLLQILDLRISTSVASVRLPNTLWKLGELRHLLLPSRPYEIMGSSMMRVDTLIWLERLENLEVRNFKADNLLKLKNLRRLCIKETMSQEWLDNLVNSPALKSGILESCSFGVNGDVVNKAPNVLSSLNCTHRLQIVDQITVHIEDVAFPQCLRVLSFKCCKLEGDPMGILGSLTHLKDLVLGMNSFVGRMIICKSNSFHSLKTFTLWGLMDLESWILEEGSMPKLRRLTIKRCARLKNIPQGLPSSVDVTCSPCVRGIAKYGTCLFYKTISFPVASYERHFVKLSEDINRLLEAPLRDSRYKKVVLRGQGGLGKTTNVKALCHSGVLDRHFQTVGWACPTTSCAADFPRRMLQAILRDLNPRLPTEDLSQKTCSKLIDEIQQFMQLNKCLLILLNLEDVDRHLTYLDTIFPTAIGTGSKLLITTTDNHVSTTTKDVLVLDLPPPAAGSWYFLGKRLKDASENAVSNASIQAAHKMVKNYSVHPLSLVMAGGLAAMKDAQTEWEANDDSSEMTELPQIFEFCYKDLPPHLSRCLLFLAIFPGDSEISTKKLYKMWIAAGLVQLEHDKVHLAEVLEDITESYLAELVQRGMVKVGKRGPTGKMKTCRLHFALQDLCLKKAREEQLLSIVDQSSESLGSTSSNGNFVQLGIHLKHRNPSPTGSDQQLSLVINSLGSPTSLTCLVFDCDVGDPSHKTSTWDWFDIICSRLHLLQVLDLQGMWMTDGPLPEQVGRLRNLRYLSLKGTWVTKLPSSIEELTRLETLDLRVMGSIFITDVLWKLEYLRHVYFPDAIDHRSPVLQLSGLHHLQTLVNLETGKVNLNQLPKMKRVKRISIRRIHAAKELDDILPSLSKSIELTMNSEIINSNPNILSTFQNLHKLRIKGRISVSLRPEMFPAHLEELTLKHTKLDQDPIPILDKLSKLSSLYFDHESFLGEEMTLSPNFHALNHLKFCSLHNLVRLKNPQNGMSSLESIVIRDCWRLKEVNLPIKDPQQRTLEI